MQVFKEDFRNHNMSKLIKGAVVPRPIAWISTISKNGVKNLAPFSFFTVASMKPITFCISIGSGARAKDTLVNIQETKAFVINIVSEDLANQMHTSSKGYKPDVDEFEQAGTKSETAVTVKVPRVAEARVHLECELDRVIQIGSSHLVLGTLVGYHAKDDVYLEGDKIDPYKLKPVGRMAGDYSFIREFYSLPNDDLPK